MKFNILDKEWCNYVKLMAAILVAVSHYATVIVVNNHWSNSDFLRLWCQGGYIGVAIFFFLSGYGLMESEKKRHLSIIEFVKKRFPKIYFPVLMVSVFWIPMCYVMWNEPHPTILHICYEILWGFNDCVLWFVKILFLLYVFFSIACFFLQNNHAKWAHFFLIGGTLFSTFVAFENDYPFISVPLFGMGVYSSLLDTKKICKIPNSIMMLLFMAIFCFVVFLFSKSTDAAHGLLNCLVLSIILCGLYSLSTPPLSIFLNLLLMQRSSSI